MEEEENAEDFEGKSIPICPCCLAPIEGDVYVVQFCGKCFAPIGGLAGINSYESIFAEGFIYRAAVNSPTKKITVYTVKAFAVFWFACAIFLLLAGIPGLLEDPSMLPLFGLALFYSVCSVSLYRQVSRNYQRYLEEQT